ncbi:MAG: thiamine pyrophosphate-binding protein [bacterium]|nr:thiamine pyrophosphate-binding protein [bacterium]
MTGSRPTALGRDIFFEYLVSQGVRYIFGNPGTTELPMVDGCNDYPSIKYVLSLHEDVAVGEAIGYARGSGKVGVVNLHVTPGVAHGLGNLYNAHRARVPLLVTAGQHHTGLRVQDPILASDLLSMVGQFTKWSYEVRFLEELPMVMQRAFKELATPPFAPVFVSIPPNVLLEHHDGFGSARVTKPGSSIADDGAIRGAVRVLASAERPMIVAGDGVGHARAWRDLAAIAEALGARVHTEGYATLWNFPSSHPLYLGPMPNLAAAMRDHFARADVAFLCGVTSSAPVSRYDEGGPLVPFHVQTVVLDDSPSEVGKNHPASAALLGDVGANLRRLRTALESAPLDRSVAVQRGRRVSDEAAARRTDWDRKAKEEVASGSLTAVGVAAAIRDTIPAGGIFVDETISNRPWFVNILDFPDPLSYFGANGISLGYSVGAAAGLQVAQPDRKVVVAVGDGSFLYYPHALWNLANRNLPVLVVILNNGGYRVLELIVNRMGGPWSEGGSDLPGIDIHGPEVDFVALAGSMGVPGERVDALGTLGPAIKRGMEASSPYVVDVVLDRSVGGASIEGAD